MEILQRVSPPPAPVFSPRQAAASLRVAPGFRVELVAAEPLVVDPVAIDWDDAGRLYAVEMRGFMPDIEGHGEDAPIGRVVVLEDRDGDGRMDRSSVLLDGLVMPRAVRVLPQGILVAEPPNLWLCPLPPPGAGGEALRCRAPQRLGDYALTGNVEHAENALLPGLDGWLYSAKSARRLRIERAADGRARLVEQPTAFRGQWGLAQDEDGRFLYNANPVFLQVDLLSGDALRRHPATDPRDGPPGFGVSLLPDAGVHSVRVNPGLNRAYAEPLREDGRQRLPTAVSGLALNEDDALGPQQVGSVFVPEPAANVVAHIQLRGAGAGLAAEHVLQPDPDWGRREFLASTDERFRPVSAAIGPRGALYVVDMYRGVIQHATYVSDYLADYVARQGLATPLGLGRIWRIVRETQPGAPDPLPVDLSRADTATRVDALGHPTRWQRDRAALWLAAAPAQTTRAPLRAAVRAGAAQGADPVAQRRALRALHVLAATADLDPTTWHAAQAAGSPRLRAAAASALPSALATAAEPEVAAVARALAERLDDADARVRVQAMLALGALPPARRPLERMLDAMSAHDSEPLFATAFTASLAGVERPVLERVLDRSDARGGTRDGAALRAGVRALLVRPDAQRASDVAALLERVAALPQWPGDDGGGRSGLRTQWLAAMGEAARAFGYERVALAAAPRWLDDAALEAEAGDAELRRAARAAITWPGDSRSGPAVAALRPEQAARAQRGAALFATSCGLCHGGDGRGQAGVVPPLAGSPWVLDSDGWLVRIALHGIRGPLSVGRDTYEGVMPGHRSDPRFDDEALAGVLTHIRRAWGNAGAPIDPAVVSAVRRREAARRAPWTVEELEALDDVDHRYDRFAGSYRIGGVPMRLRVRREGSLLHFGVLGMGSGELEAVGERVFAGDGPGQRGVRIEFFEEADGRVERALLELGDGTRVRLERVE